MYYLPMLLGTNQGNRVKGPWMCKKNSSCFFNIFGFISISAQHCISVGWPAWLMRCNILTFHWGIIYCCHEVHFYFLALESWSKFSWALPNFLMLTSQSNGLVDQLHELKTEIMKKQTIYIVYIFLVPIGRKFWRGRNS